MAIELTLLNGSGELELKNGLPPDYNGPLLRGAIALHTDSHAGQFVLQEFETEAYTLRFLRIKLFKAITATGKINMPGLYSLFQLKSGLRKELSPVGKLHIRQDQYSCFFSGLAECKAKFERNKEYQTIDIFYTPQLLEQLLPFFPELKDVLAKDFSTVLPENKCWMLPSMNEIISQILSCPYDEATCSFYFDLKVRELLYQVLQNTYRRKGSIYQFTPWETARIYEAKNILETYISKKPPSFRSLSRQVALNELKLKTGFRQCFNMGMFEWLAEQKMQHARQLILNTNKPIKAIAQLVGYPRSTNFITAFRKRFGTTPRSLRG
jgi:AraC-like DNA-binding protein